MNSAPSRKSATPVPPTRSSTSTSSLDRPASNKLYVIDVESAVVTGSVDVGQGAHGVVVEEGGARAFVTNLVDGTVSVVDTASLTTTATIEVGEAPNGISCWHADGGMP